MEKEPSQSRSREIRIFRPVSQVCRIPTDSHKFANTRRGAVEDEELLDNRVSIAVFVLARYSKYETRETGGIKNYAYLKPTRRANFRIWGRNDRA